MIKPKKLKPGDSVAIVSLSWGGLGDAQFLHKLDIAKKRLRDDFGLNVVVMPSALKGSSYLYEHPEARAKDWMAALQDDTIDAIFSSIGGDDTIRLLPYIDFDMIRKYPKIFMGFSDTTANHLMMYHAGVVSFYGPAIMAGLSEYVKLFDYTKQAVCDVLFKDSNGYLVPSSPTWTDQHVDWNESNIDVEKQLKPDPFGYELLQGTGKVQGLLLGGCVEVLRMCVGTSIWPSLDEWNGAILFLETSEEMPTPDTLKYDLRNFAAQGIFKVISGVVFGKPYHGKYYDEYKKVLTQVISQEEKRSDLPVLYNLNFGHSEPIGILPYGIEVELDCEQKTMLLLESATE